LIIIALTFFLMAITGIVTMLFISEKMLLVTELCIIIPAIILVVAGGYSFPRVFRLQNVSFKTIGISFLIGVSLVILMDEIDRLRSILYPMPDQLTEKIIEMMTISSVSDGIVIIFSAVIVAGVFEEMLFRGFLQKAFERDIGVLGGVVLCSLVFSLIHMNPWTATQILLLGSIFGLMAWKSNSIWPSAIAHAINNGLAVHFINIPEDTVTWYSWHGHVNPLLILAAVAGIYFGFKCFCRTCQ